MPTWVQMNQQGMVVNTTGSMRTIMRTSATRSELTLCRLGASCHRVIYWGCMLD